MGELRWFRYSFVTVEEHCKARTPCGEYREFVWFLYSAIMIIFQVFQGWHKHVACNSFSVSLQTVEELRKAPRFVVGIGNKIFEQSGFFASMVNSFSLGFQNLWMLSQCSLYSATLLCQACLSFMWPRSMPSNRAIFPSLPFGMFLCVSSNRSRHFTHYQNGQWTSHLTKLIGGLHTLPSEWNDIFYWKFEFVFLNMFRKKYFFGSSHFGSWIEIVGSFRNVWASGNSMNWFSAGSHHVLSPEHVQQQ